MKREKLKVEKRKILGKKVHKLRKEGILPANMYGKDIKSTAVQVTTKDFIEVYKQTGETGLVDIELDGTITPVLVQNVYRDFRGIYLHADFFKVNLKEKVKANIPLEFVGEPKAVTEKIGILMHILSEVEVEALPADLPEKIEVNVEQLATIGEHILVSDLKVSADVIILTDAGQTVAKIDELVSKEAQEQAAAEEAAAAEAKAEGAEGSEAIAEGTEAIAEGTESTKEETKPQE
jgi:large subunit ribosomal protein L25